MEMEKAIETTILPYIGVIQGLSFPGARCPQIIPIMDNQMKKKMEHEMATGVT